MVVFLVQISSKNILNQKINFSILSKDKEEVIITSKEILVNKLVKIEIDFDDNEFYIKIENDEMNFKIDFNKDYLFKLLNYKNEILDFKCIKFNVKNDFENLKNIADISKFDQLLNQIKEINFLNNLEKEKSNLIIKNLFEKYSELKIDYDKSHNNYLKLLDNYQNIKSEFNELKSSIKIKRSCSSNKENHNPFSKKLKPNVDDYIVKKYLDDFVESKKLETKFEMIKPGVYKFKNKIINIFYHRNNLKIRIGGGYISLEDFYNSYIKIKKDNTINENDISNILRSISPIKSEISFI